MYIKQLKNKKWSYLIKTPSVTPKVLQQTASPLDKTYDKTDRNIPDQTQNKWFTLLFHFNNMSTTEWRYLEKELREIDKVNFRVVKNKIVLKLIPDSIGCAQLFQGPICIIHINNSDKIGPLFPLLKKIKYTSKSVFLGGIYSNQFYTSTDFERLGSNPFHETLFHLQNSTNSIFSLLKHPHYSLIWCLSQISSTHSCANSLKK